MSVYALGAHRGCVHNLRSRLGGQFLDISLAWRFPRGSVKCPSTLSVDQVDLLHNFWHARGVQDFEHRAKLIDHGSTTDGDNEWQAGYDAGDNEPALPGVHALWHLESNANQIHLVRALTAKLLELRVLLGNRSDIDVASMLIRCPRLLTLTSSDVIHRLVRMKGAEGAGSVDIGKVVEAQPSLLCSQSTGLESPEAWKYGLTSAADDEWLTHLQALERYKRSHDHTHVGFSSEDDLDLARFARMQRASFKKGTLPSQRQEALASLGFEFDADEAEWTFMYNRLKKAQLKASTENSILDGGFDFLLNNWCSVQRISQRSGMMSSARVDRLDLLEFDWTGADALS